jgi:hypothetical protein
MGSPELDNRETKLWRNSRGVQAVESSPAAPAIVLKARRTLEASRAAPLADVKTRLGPSTGIPLLSAAGYPRQHAVALWPRRGVNDLDGLPSRPLGGSHNSATLRLTRSWAWARAIDRRRIDRMRWSESVERLVALPANHRSMSFVVRSTSRRRPRGGIMCPPPSSAGSRSCWDLCRSGQTRANLRPLPPPGKRLRSSASTLLPDASAALIEEAPDRRIPRTFRERGWPEALRTHQSSTAG